MHTSPVRVGQAEQNGAALPDPGRSQPGHGDRQEQGQADAEADVSAYGVILADQPTPPDQGAALWCAPVGPTWMVAAVRRRT